MANDPPFATLNHFAGDLGIPSESAPLRIGISFPAGKHGDQVDALGLVGQLLDRMLKGNAPKVVKPKPKLLPGQVILPGPPEPVSGARITI
jgi:hypothetical protein